MNFSKGKANNAPDGHHASGTADGVSVGMLTRSPSVVPEVYVHDQRPLVCMLRINETTGFQTLVDSAVLPLH